jgi:hypothetical protein
MRSWLHSHSEAEYISRNKRINAAAATLRSTMQIQRTSALCKAFSRLPCNICHSPRRGNGQTIQISVRCPFTCRQMWHRSKECLVTYQVETCCGVTTTCLYLGSKHVTVWTTSIIRHVGWPSTRVVGTQSQWQGQYLACVAEYQCSPK